MPQHTFSPWETLLQNTAPRQRHCISTQLAAHVPPSFLTARLVKIGSFSALHRFRNNFFQQPLHPCLVPNHSNHWGDLYSLCTCLVVFLDPLKELSNRKTKRARSRIQTFLRIPHNLGAKPQKFQCTCRSEIHRVCRGTANTLPTRLQQLMLRAGFTDGQCLDAKQDGKCSLSSDSEVWRWTADKNMRLNRHS